MLLMRFKLFLIATFLVIACSSFFWLSTQKPTIYLIGDSTVDNGSGNKGLWGWGKFLPQFFDSSKISIKNYSQGGTSARTFYTSGIWDKKINKRGMWDTVATKLKKGDYLIIQFGLNDQGSIDDSLRARGTLKGIGTDSIKIFNKVIGKEEVVYSFGAYLRKFIGIAKSKDVKVVICSTIPKNVWKEGKIVRGENGFANWALEVAKQENVPFIDLNNLVANKYELDGELKVTQNYHVEPDKTHTTKEGATLNAFLVAKALKEIKQLKLNNTIIQLPNSL